MYFSGKMDEDPYVHLIKFKMECSLFRIRGVEDNIAKLTIFPFSLNYSDKD